MNNQMLEVKYNHVFLWKTFFLICENVQKSGLKSEQVIWECFVFALPCYCVMDGCFVMGVSLLSDDSFVFSRWDIVTVSPPSLCWATIVWARHIVLVCTSFLEFQDLCSQSCYKWCVAFCCCFFQDRWHWWNKPWSIPSILKCIWVATAWTGLTVHFASVLGWSLFITLCGILCKYFMLCPCDSLVKVWLVAPSLPVSLCRHTQPPNSNPHPLICMHTDTRDLVTWF